MNLFKNNKICLFFILFFTAVCFSPVLICGFVNWDDPAYLLKNPYVLTLNFSTIIQSFQTSVEHTYVPLTNLIFSIEHALFGFNAVIFHLNNLFLHLANVVLIFLLAQQLGVEKRGATIGALLFAVHPIHVEPVAWVTERKGLLSTLFYLLAMRFYIDYVTKSKMSNYWLAIVMGLLSMLAKPMGYSLPFVFLLLDWLVKRKWDYKVIVDKIIPFLIIVIFSMFTFSKEFLNTPYLFSDKILIWVWSIYFYLTKFLLPIHLSPLYDLPQPVNLGNPHYIAGVCIVLIFICVLYLFKKDKFLIFSILFFGVTIGALIVRAGWNFGSFTVVADRFMYLPSVAFCLYLGSVVVKWFDQTKNIIYQKLIYWMIILSFLNLGIMTFKQAQIWQNDLSLWAHAIEINPYQSLAYVHRADYFRQKGDSKTAMADIDQALRYQPQNFQAYHSLGILSADAGYYQSALLAFNKAQQINSNLKDIYLNRGIAFLKLEKFNEALSDFNKYIELAPQSYQGYGSRAMVFNLQGKNHEALLDFNRALKIYPDNFETLMNRGVFYATQQRYEEALTDFDRALQLDPQHPAALKNRELALNYFDKKKAQSLKVKVFDAGYGDAIFLSTPDHFHVLIDSGERESAVRMLEYFQTEGIDKIQLGIITHPHKNHFGGFLDLFEKVSFDRIIINGDMNGDEGYEELLTKIKTKNIPLEVVKRGDVIDGIDLNIKILHPDKLEYSTNGNSLAMLIEKDREKIFLTGDIEPAQQDDILINFSEVKDAQLVQIPHHGGELSESFIRAFQHTKCFVSTGVNENGLPKEDQLKQFSILLRTDKSGDLSF